MNVTLRPYQPADWLDVCRVHDAARPHELAGSFDPRAFVPLADDSEHEGLLRCVIDVAVDADEVVGFVGVDAPMLAWLYVDPSVFRRGIGAMLLRHALSQLDRSAWTLCCGNNEAALALYEHAGFVVESRYVGSNAGYNGPSVRLALDPTKRGWTLPRASEH